MMSKTFWSKLKLPSSKGRHGEEEDMSSLISKPDVNEEYKEAFRTKSYIEICNKVQGQLVVKAANLDEGQPPSSSSLPPPPPPTQYLHLSEYLLEPHQEALTSIFKSTNHHQFLINYLEITLEACRYCESLLIKARQARNSCRSIKKVINLIKRSPPEVPNWTHKVYRNLASFALRSNPFSTTEKFQDLHKNHTLLLQELTLECRKTRKRAKLNGFIKRAMASFLVLGCGGLAIALLVLAMHTIMAGPGLVVGSLGLFLIKKMKRKCNEEWLDGLAGQLDIAARGVYIMINDFDTMSRLVRRLCDEMDHRKFVADICVRKRKDDMLVEVVREFQTHEDWFLEQLEELEKQIYLCLLDINRSIRLLVREMQVKS